MVKFAVCSEKNALKWSGFAGNESAGAGWIDEKPWDDKGLKHRS
jgi:hypothetical protein